MQSPNSLGAGEKAPWERDPSAEEQIAWAEGRLTMDPHRLVHEIVKRGHDWADKDAAASALEETRHSVLGQMVQAYIEAGRSATAAEHMAKASPMYRQHVAKMTEARRLANRAKVNYEAGKTFVDLMRTRESSRRAEMKLGGSIT